MAQLIASGKNSTNRYGLKILNPSKTLTKTDAWQIGDNFQHLANITQGYSLSSSDGFVDSLVDGLSIIDETNKDSYKKILSQEINTLIAFGNFLDVDNSSTANAITLNQAKITTDNAPNGNNYAEVNTLPFKFKKNLKFRFKAKDTNTGATTIQIPNLSGLTGSISLLDSNYNQLQSNSIIAGQFYEIICDVYNSNNVFILNTISYNDISKILLAGNFYNDSGTANNYILTNSFTSPTQYITGMLVRFRTTNANTGASTVNVASLGVKNIKKADGTTDLIAGDIATGTDIELRYDGTNFLLNSVVLASATATTQGTQYLNKPITISNNIADADNDIDFSAGNFIFNDYSGEATVIAMTKRLQSSGSWSAGTGGNMLLSGVKEVNSAYHLFAIYNPTTNTSDFAAIKGVANTDPNPTAFLPSGYTKYNYRGSVLTDLSGNIRAFTQYGNFFEYKTAILSYYGSLTTTETFLPLPVPLGVICESRLSYNAQGTSQSNLYIFFRNPTLTSRNNTHNSFSGVGSTPYDIGGQTNVIADQSSRIYISASHNTIPFSISILGYKNFKL